MKKTLLTVFIQTVLLLMTLEMFGQSQALKALDRGRRALSLGDFVTAQRELENCKRLNPTTPYVFAFLAKTYYFQSKLDLAIYAFNKSLETDYTNRLNGNIDLIYHNTVSLGIEEQEMLDPAIMHYQRGRVYHLKRNSRMALLDMERALAINPYYEEAKVYLDHVRAGKGPLLIEAPITYTEITEINSKKEKRPESKNFIRAEDTGQDYEDLRRDRSVYYRIEKPRNRSERKMLDKKKKRKFYEGIKYYDPNIGHSSQDYIKIESIQLSSNSTIVNFKVENPSKDSAFVLRMDQDMRITDRSGSRSNTLRMVRLSNFSRTGTNLPAGGRIRFSVIFPAISEDMQFINIVEGSRNDGQEWNFYDVDLINKK